MHCTHDATPHDAVHHQRVHDASPHDATPHDASTPGEGMNHPRGGCNEGIPYILEETPHIPVPPSPGIPPKWGPVLEAKSHSYIDAPDGRQRDLAHISCSGGALKQHPQWLIWDPISGPQSLGNISAPDGRQRDLAHIALPWGALK